MREWSVLVEARSKTETIEMDDERIVSLMNALHLHYGAVSAGGSFWSARVTVEASSPASAVDWAVAVVTSAARAAGMPDWPYVRFEALSGDELDREIAELWPNLERRGRGTGSSEQDPTPWSGPPFTRRSGVEA